MQPIRVGLVEDDTPTREALRQLIDETPGYACIVCEGSLESAMALIVERLPDVLLLDIGLPGMSGVEGTRILRERVPGVAIVMLTVHAEREQVFSAICNGACGYLLKKTPPERLLAAIRDVRDGGAAMSPEIARQVMGLVRRAPAQSKHALNAQEVRVLRLLADGHQYGAAGRQLGISVNTVRNYIRSIYEKLHVHTKSEAVSKAIRQGILE